MGIVKELVILGPTATGKTDLALNLAKRFNGELIAADSRQVYRELDIGTGKLPIKESKVKRQKDYWEIDGIRVWMYDVADPKIQYTVADYVRNATLVVEGILERNKLPIIVGGTGLYIKALTEGLSNLEIPINPDLRKELERLSLKQLQEKLQSLNFDRWKSLNDSDRQNSRRLIRAIELSPFPHSENKNSEYDLLKIGLIAPREVLYKNVDSRVLSRIKEGMIEEANNLLKQGLTLERMRQLGLEYGVLADYLDGQFSKQELIRIMQNKIHRLVRRQITWFKKVKDINWFDITKEDYIQEVEKLVQFWYDSADAKKN